MELSVDKLFSEERLSEKFFYTLLFTGICQQHGGCWRRVSEYADLQCFQHMYLAVVHLASCSVAKAKIFGTQTSN